MRAGGGAGQEGFEVGGPRQECLDDLDAVRLGKLGEDVTQVGVRLESVGIGGLCRAPNYAESGTDVRAIPV